MKESDIRQTTSDWYKNYYARKGADRNNPLKDKSAIFQSLAQENALIRAVASTNTKPETSTLLDVGCGTGQSLLHFIKLGFMPENVTVTGGTMLCFWRLSRERCGFAAWKQGCALFFAAAMISRFISIATAIFFLFAAAPVPKAFAAMAGGGFSVDGSQSGGAAASRHLRDSVARGYGAMHSAGATGIAATAGGGYEISAGFEQYGFGPEYFSSIDVKRSGGWSFGFNEDAAWDWEVPALGGAPITVDVYIRLAPEYGQTPQKPSIILAGPGINDSAAATEAAFGGWEKLTVSGTPSSTSALVLSVRGHSRAEGARFHIDDIAVAQN